MELLSLSGQGQYCHCMDQKHSGACGARLSIDAVQQRKKDSRICRGHENIERRKKSPLSTQKRAFGEICLSRASQPPVNVRYSSCCVHTSMLIWRAHPRRHSRRSTPAPFARQNVLFCTTPADQGRLRPHDPCTQHSEAYVEHERGRRPRCLGPI